MSAIKRVREDYKALLHGVPAMVTTIFILSVVLMNLMASKELYRSEYFCLNCGLALSWISFLCMDCICKRFGPKAATQVSVFAICVNTLACLIFFVASIIPTETDFSAFNSVIGGTWFILLSSTIAFLLSAVVNNFSNYAIGKMFGADGESKKAYAAASYISTFLGQFIDNLTFAVLTFMLFAPIFWDGFRWTFLQCVTCSLLGALLELVMEVVFSPIGYIVLRDWKKNRVGEAYLEAHRETGD